MTNQCTCKPPYEKVCADCRWLAKHEEHCEKDNHDECEDQ